MFLINIHKINRGYFNSLYYSFLYVCDILHNS
nr:MAG TPA: hypothetical protein [Caudoviricetes sp.]